MRRFLLLAVLAAFLSLPRFAHAQSGSFGTSVVLDGSDLFVGEPNTSFREGSVYVYTWTEAGWQQTQRLTAPEAAWEDGFGTVLAREGSTLLVGQKKGPLHVFAQEGQSWRHAGVIDGPGTEGLDPGCQQYGYCGTDFGMTLALQGDWLLIGNPGEIPQRRRGEEETPVAPMGVVHAYQRGEDGNWRHRSEISSQNGVAGDRFGQTIHFQDNVLLVGAPGWNDPYSGLESVGQVVQFVLQEGMWYEAGWIPFFAESAAAFGSSMSMQGRELLVGAPGVNRSRGAVYVYEWQDDGSWAPVRTLRLTDAEPGERFGSGIAHTNNAVWVGAPAEREFATGSTWVFQPDADGRLLDTPVRVQLEDTVERDGFGTSLVAQGDMAIVSAPGMHHQSGALYVYADPAAAPQTLVGPPDGLGAITGEKMDCVDGKIGPFDCQDVELLSFVPNTILRDGDRARGVRTNDNWGWTDPETGREYALVGRNDGTSFIDITDPMNPVLIGDLPKPWGTPPSQLWRDIKTYKGYAYIVADGAGDHGMQVFDLRRLRDVANPPVLFEPDLHYTGIASSHNVIINEETGFAYTVDGPTCGGGLYMMDIREPLQPKFVGCSKGGERGTHDSQCVVYQGPDARYRGREICLNSNGAYFEIMDVTDKSTPVTVSTASSPNAAYIHQGWLTDDQRYFYQDDESDVVAGKVPTTRTLVWDLTDLEDPILVNEFMGSMPASAHNLYIKDNMVYQANYRYGLHVLDISDPENPVEVGYFDTAPTMEGPGFSGAWSTYPFFESGTVIITSLREGVFFLRSKKKES
jgi:choice-of-anchor B domain-containing protein